MKQNLALKIMQDGHNAFLTGSAGAGKTYVLNQFIDWAKSEGKQIAITASTGIAATHINGMTIHSFSGMGIADRWDPYIIETKAFKALKAARIKRCEILIIDEISMLSAEQFYMVDQIFKRTRKKPGPFGGVQIIVCGDFFQLPPISRSREFQAKFAFESESWAETHFAVLYLSEQHRHSDAEYNELLESIRSSSVRGDHLEKLDSRAAEKPDDFETTHLYTRNINVENFNLAQLEKITDEEKYTFHMKEKGPEKRVAQLKKSCLALENLQLKKGALVMAIKNDFEGKYANGSIGSVTGFSEDSDDAQTWPVVKFRNGNECKMKPETWELVEGEIVMAKVTQVPLRLAWAITVHKSQGMTLDQAHIDLTRAFEPGMGYVALSRVRSLSDFTLMGYNEMSLKVNGTVSDFDTDLREKSTDLETCFAPEP